MKPAQGILPETVSDLTARIKRQLEEGFPDVLVVGELSYVKRAASGHVYVTLKDEGAVLAGVIWKRTATRLWFDLHEGMEVLARGRIVVYSPRGQYQLDIRDLRPRGVGALRLAFEKLRRRLEEEGLLDPARKRPLPFLPLRIGVVTSPVGAAIRDVLQVLSRRFPHAEVVIHPVVVQGEGAAEMIAGAIRALNDRGGFDVLIVTRGGGSVEDLWAFNEEPVARAIAASEIPVISAVGHEVDFTIADLVADVRAPTPSAAAEIVAPDARELRRGLEGLGRRIDVAVRGGLKTRWERLHALSGSYGLNRFPDRLREMAQRLDELGGRAAGGMGLRLATLREAVADLSGRAEALSPVRVLARGYSVTTVEGEGAPLRDAGRVRAGTRIRTRLARGNLLSRVVAPRADAEVQDG